MRTGLIFLLHTVFLAFGFAAAAQPQIAEIRASERFIASGETGDPARQLALLAAKRKILDAAATRFRALPQVKEMPLRPNELEAFLSVLVPVEEDSTSPGAETIATVVARFNDADVLWRLHKLRTDPDAAEALVDLWKQSEESYREFAALPVAGTRNTKAQQTLLEKLNVKHVVAQVFSSLAKTEESPASRRVPSEKGRQRAVQLAEMALAMGPRFPETHHAMGYVLMDSDLPEAASAEYREALTLNPASSSVRVKLAEALRIQGRVQDAIAELRETLRIDPNSAAAHNDLGFIFGSQQNNAEATAEYQAALRLAPDFIEAHNNLAIALARQGRIADSVAEFREMVRIDPDSVLGYYNLGIALADMDLDTESAEAFRHAVRINPNHYNSRFDLAELFRLEGKFDEAVKQFREYIRLVPDTPQNQRNIRRAREFVETHENP